MTAFEKLKLRENSFGSTQKEQMIYNSKYLVDSMLSDDPSFKEGVQIMGKGSIDIRMNNRRIVNKIPQIDIQASLSDSDEDITFRMSDVFFYDNGYWLCTDSYELHDIYKTGIIQECNYLLHFQNQETLEIISRWCVAKSPYSSGLNEGNVITVENGKLELRMPYDDETMLLDVDRRFLIGHANRKPRAYKAIEFNDVTDKYEAKQEGFLTIVVQRDELLTDDNWDLMIAGYVSPPIPQPEPIGSCKIVYSGEPILKVGGSIKTINFVAYDGDNNPLNFNENEILWELIKSPELETLNQVVVISEIGNQIRIQVKSGDAAISMSFILRATVDDPDFGLFTSEQEFFIDSLL